MQIYGIKQHIWLHLVRVASVMALLVVCAQTPLHAADGVTDKSSAIPGRQQEPVSVTLSQFKVVQDGAGKSLLQDARVVVPGDLLEYRAVYRNRGTEPLSVLATLPVPEALEYEADSAAASSPGGARIAHTVALKDARYAAEPLQRRIATSDGGSLMQAVPYAEYRFVRWKLEKLAPGASVEVSLRARVARNTEIAPEAAK